MSPGLASPAGRRHADSADAPGPPQGHLGRGTPAGEAGGGEEVEGWRRGGLAEAPPTPCPRPAPPRL